MALGLIVGIGLAIGVMADIKVEGMPLLVAIGLGKLSFLAALGLMGAGAGLRRLALRAERRDMATLARPDGRL